MRKKFDYSYCSASPILEWLGDKWALVVLMKINEQGVARFSELKRLIPPISEKMLSTALHSLEVDGLVYRKVYQEIPPRVEYYISDFGKTLIPYIENIIQWGQNNFAVIMDNRKNYKNKR